MIASSQSFAPPSLTITDLDTTAVSHITPPGEDVIAGLTQRQKTLPPRYFYDATGSQLFEQICTLPEYYLTRTEAAILAEFAGEIAAVTGRCELVELGSGSSTKTRHLLDAYHLLGGTLDYVPIDVSREILVESAEALLADYPRLRVQGLVGTYEQALTHLPVSPDAPRLVIFLGSTLGNLTPEACDRFFAQLETALNPGDYLLLGVDLQKDPNILEAAYNDAQGVTAAFNRNILAHLNWRFGGNFDLEQFQHRAVYNAAAGQIEAYLDSGRSQTVQLTDLNLTVNFAPGESLHTEISRKFHLPTLQTELQNHHLTTRQIWTDPQTWFAVVLAQRQS
ncbi:MAG: L-histidine N(alpha)-methyltransferase [Spirulina sp. DLM2.Bin59]|nr:MAG: L-histidine N(alpha)-methyltransferase [Spirulina sp. DLM2.Bin59]